MFATKFTETNFSRKVTHAWLPDVFGFPASVPQILSKSGIKYLASQKLSQNKINKFDNYLYRWKGLDGSEIIMHNFPENSYDSSARATSLEDIENNYKEKDICPYALMVYGVGDGGAGPGEEHIERLNRIRNISILPDVSFGHVEDFFAKVEQYHKNLPLITGELYFEAHQGCFTTESRTKANNRKMENNLHDAEFFISTAQSIPASMFTELSKLWKETLTLQFHDIIAGTCIARVYQETEKQYFHLNSRSQNIINFCRSELATRIDTKQVKNPHIIFNSISFPRSEWINIQGVWLKVKVSPFGYNVIEPIAQEIIEPRRKNNTIENNYVRLTFSDSGDLQSLYDLRHGKEFISEKLSSEFRAYHEDAGFFAAWDFAPDYRAGESSILLSEKMESIIDGPTISMVVHYRYHSSKLRLAFTLCQDSPRVDIRTYIDWHEPNVSLKIKFPVSIKTDTAQCHTQFGVIDRPTHSNDSFAFAKDEIPAHLWVDISDTISGLALISKDKYGFRVKDQSLELTLLRSQHKPGEAITKKNHEDYLKNNFSDIGEQEFTFSLLPHTGDYYEGKVFKHSYMLNHPLHILPVDSHRGILPPSLSFISQNSTHIIIETVKPAEDGNGIIVRLYECYGKKTSTLLKWEYPYDYIQFVDMQENALKPPVYCERAYPLDFTPFEIVTVRITE